MAEIQGFPAKTTVNGNRASCGGQCDPKPLAYSLPKGPTSQMQQGPGLHGTNHGPCGTQGKR